jgi:hypothetical protein
VPDRWRPESTAAWGGSQCFWDRGQLDRDQPIARVVPSQGFEVAVYAAVPVKIDGDRLVEWVRRIEALKKSAYVLAIRRFSNPPRIEDLTDLALEDAELSEIVTCRPSRCGLKLSAPEMAELQHAAAEAGIDWKIRLQEQFRLTVLDRVYVYLEGRQVGPYEDHAGQMRRLA